MPRPAIPIAPASAGTAGLRHARLWILLSYFLSGAAALTYEVLWVRLVTLFCGHTGLAVSATLAAFMAGMAGGSWAAGRVADGFCARRILKSYILLELGIAVAGLLSRPLLKLVGTSLLGLGVVTMPPPLQAGVYFVASFAVLLTPALLMGASLPLLTRLLSLDPAGPAAPDAPLGLLYGLNTLGGAAGAIAAGFLLIPAIGSTKSLFCAAGLNVVCAGLAWAAHGGLKDLGPAGEGLRGGTFDSGAKPLFILIMTGAAAMICQAAWTRALSMLIGSSTYALTVMLSTFLIGLALGGLAVHILRPRLGGSWEGLAGLLASISLWVYLGIFLFERLPYSFMRLEAFFTGGGGAMLLVQFLMAAAIMLVPAVLMGGVLPWTAACLSPRREDIAAATGRLYAANTVGAIIGSAGAGLFLLPRAGLENSLVIAVWFYGLAALFAAGSRLRVPALAAAAVLLACASVLQPDWQIRSFQGGRLIRPPERALASFRSFRSFYSVGDLIFHRSGTSATVSVFEDSWGKLQLRLNGKPDASDGTDMDTQLLLGYLPLLLHPGEPRTALVVGLGAGVTAGALATERGIERLDVVEIEPMVEGAARLFGRANRGVLDDPRVGMHFADARQFLAAPGPRYDLISSEPSNPWIAGISYLYTREAFALARDRLEPDGIFLQWLHSYRMDPDDFRMVVRTLSEVFPHVMVFGNGRHDFFLLGSKAPWRIAYKRLERLYSENRDLREDMESLGGGLEHPYTLLKRCFFLDGEDLRRYAGGARIHTDDLPSLEFTAPRSMRLTGTGKIISSALRAAAQSDLPRGLTGLLLTDSLNARALNAAAARALDGGDLDSAARALEGARKLGVGGAWTWTNMGRLAERGGRSQEALSAYLTAVSMSPESLEARLRLGWLQASQGKGKEAFSQFAKVLELEPGNPEASLGAGRLFLKNGQKEEARLVLESAKKRPTLSTEIKKQLFEALRRAR